jgi:MFS family permease
MFLGAFSGRIVDAGFYRYLMVSGLGLQILGIFATSFVSQYWQFLLAQGVCQGIGGGLVLVPTMAIVSSYFSKKRALAVCGMSVGSATGGIIFPLIAQQLLGRIGIGNTIRIMGSVFVVNAAIALAIIRPRNTPRKNGALIELAAFRDPWYSLFGMGMLFTMLGLYFAYYYVSGSKSQTPPLYSCG